MTWVFVIEPASQFPRSENRFYGGTRRLGKAVVHPRRGWNLLSMISLELHVGPAKEPDCSNVSCSMVYE